MRAACVVPAMNEAPTIGPVLVALCEADCLDKVIVVSDGSSDETCAIARSFGCVTAICLDRNRGKGEAIREGLRHTDAGAVMLADADLFGLRPDHIRALVGAVADGPFGQSCGLHDKGDPLLNELTMQWHALTGFIITGERCVRRELLDRIPPSLFTGFAIEVAINASVVASGMPLYLTMMDNVTFRAKEAKVGIEKAREQYAKMFAQVLAAWSEARRTVFR